MAVKTVRIMCLGDIVGRPGRTLLREQQAELRGKYRVDCLIVNGENASGGVGIAPQTVEEFINIGVDVLTLGDHTWQRREMRDCLEQHADYCIRPANYPSGAPGKGWTVWTHTSGLKIGVINLIGRVFMNSTLDCPFRKADEILNGPLNTCTIRICDLHAEATSEKYAMARYLDGRVSLLVGTHTHVQTADEQVLPAGTGYITDLGMSGSGEGVIGMDSEVALGRFLSGLPRAYKLAKGQAMLCGVYADIDQASGKTVSMERVMIKGSSLRSKVAPQKTNTLRV